MGNAASTVELPGETAGSATPEKPGEGIKLYEYIRGTSAGQWELASDGARPGFYDANEDNEGQPANWFLEIEAANVDEKLGEDFEFQEADRRCTFVAGGKIWAMKFPMRATYDLFYTRYQDCLFENTFLMAADDANKAKVLGGGNALIGREDDASRMQWEEGVDENEGPAPAEREFKDRGTPIKTPARIHNVRMGAGNNSYLIRENAIEVIRNKAGGVEETGTSFQLTPAKGAAFTPSRLILARGETQMNMLTPGKRETVFQADIETGKVVNEWTFNKDGVEVPMLDIVNDTKSAQLEQRCTFLGLDKNRLARWDMRTRTGMVQQMNSPVVDYVGGKDYARGTQFSCMATSGDGYVVVGSEDGNIRLYSEKSLTRASTSIPGLGTPITSVDVTYDGKWVVATTRHYLMVVKTEFTDNNGKHTNGFKSRMGGSAPKPRLLRLKTEDVDRVGHAPLEKGKFTWVTEAGRQERWIVASVGNFTVLWNFRQVKLTQPDIVSYGGLTTCTNYHLIAKNEHVVDSVFMHDNYAPTPLAGESAMVVVTDNCVYTAAGDDSDDEE